MAGIDIAGYIKLAELLGNSYLGGIDEVAVHFD